jgi:formylglycine-generating enzyme required for sulfatase activity
MFSTKDRCPWNGRPRSIGAAAVLAASVAAGASQAAGFSEPGDAPAGYVAIPAGEFLMGSPSGEEGRDSDEKQHRVRITRGFYLKATEVTQGEWEAVMGSNPSSFKSCGKTCPVENVSWNDAVTYLNKLSDRERLPRCYDASGTFVGLSCKGYRLPTEAEWEYAARAGTTGAVYAGTWDIKGKNNAPALGPIAWYGGNSGALVRGRCRLRRLAGEAGGIEQVRHAPCRAETTERMGPVRHAGQRVGVGRTTGTGTYPGGDGDGPRRSGLG